MRLFCPECGKQLSLEHSIKVDLMSNFTYCDGVITLTKHQITNSENIRQKLSLEKTGGMFCSNCAVRYKDIEITACQCDECGAKLLVKDVQKIGETIILCSGCLAKYRHFKDFKIFGLRGPDKKTRKKRFNEVIEEVTSTRTLPDEIQQIYNQNQDENNDVRPFDSEEELFTVTISPETIPPDTPDVISSVPYYTFFTSDDSSTTIGE